MSVQRNAIQRVAIIHNPCETCRITVTLKSHVKCRTLYYTHSIVFSCVRLCVALWLCPSVRLSVNTIALEPLEISSRNFQDIIVWSKGWTSSKLAIYHTIGLYQPWKIARSRADITLTTGWYSVSDGVYSPQRMRQRRTSLIGCCRQRATASPICKHRSRRSIVLHSANTFKFLTNSK